MRVCLVRCPSPFLIDERAFPPLGLLAVAGGLCQQGHEVTVYDRDLDEMPLDFDYYGFGPTAPEYPWAVSMLERIKAVRPQARVVLGGPHATLSYARCRDDGFDCIVVGDGEIAAEEAFLSDRKLIFAESRPLDSYPLPARHLIDLHNYRFTLNDLPATTIMGSRGCPFHCGFCCKNHSNVRLCSAQRVIQEIQEVEALGFRAIAFPEDIFILNKFRTEAVCKYLKERGIIWRCLVRADLVVKYGSEFLKMMVSSGCVGVGLGVESGSETILQNIQKGESIATMKEAIRMIKAEGLYVKAFFIVGLPGESPLTLIETDQFLSEVKLDDIDCKIFQPYPGSPIFDHKEQYDIQWEDIPLENTFYKGRPAEYYGKISTSTLTTQQIVDAWKYFEETYKDWSKAERGIMCQT